MASSYPTVSDQNDKNYKTMQESRDFFRNAIEACMSGRVDDLSRMISDYLSKHPTINAYDILTDFQSEGKNLIHIAAGSSNSAVINYIIDLVGSKKFQEVINVQDNVGSTPLIYATIAEAQSVMSKLIELGADVNIPNKDGATALHFAAGDNSIARLEILIQAGAIVTL